MSAKWRVTQEESGSNLSNFLQAKLNHLTARSVKRSLEAGMCRLNGQVERFRSRLVGFGDVVEFSCDSSIVLEKSNEDPFLYVDQNLIAYNKPSGVSSEDPVLLSRVKKRAKEAILLHRLDKDTTGVLLFACNDPAAQAFFDLFKKRLIEKTYLAIVDGAPKEESGVIENYLGKLHSYQGGVIWGATSKEKGLLAITSWKKIATNKSGQSLLQCNPQTGRTHQIRVHLSEMGHKVLGDPVYGRDLKNRYRPMRTMLHAQKVSFIHPLTEEAVLIEAPLPKDFQESCKLLFNL